jgi:hypothetical protein
MRISQLQMPEGLVPASLSWDAASGSYLIKSVQGLKDLLVFSDVASYKFTLAADLDLSGAAGLYIPSFTAAPTRA